MLLLASTLGETLVPLHLQINSYPFVRIEVPLPKSPEEGLEVSTCPYAQSQVVLLSQYRGTVATCGAQIQEDEKS